MQQNFQKLGRLRVRGAIFYLPSQLSASAGNALVGATVPQVCRPVRIPPEQFTEQKTQCPVIEVRSRGKGATCVLRRHPHCCTSLSVAYTLTIAASASLLASQAKIHELRMKAVGYHDVFAFYIAVVNSFGMELQQAAVEVIYPQANVRVTVLESLPVKFGFAINYILQFPSQLLHRHGHFSVAFFDPPESRKVHFCQLLHAFHLALREQFSSRVCGCLFLHHHIHLGPAFAGICFPKGDLAIRTTCNLETCSVQYLLPIPHSMYHIFRASCGP
mmetsp:Transcript_30678/g.47324  ORF Transcript_30678/g.47324 Transcript_30678/m.47324 type:complete len:274 (+) Transcript_30678:243-1064(+)